MINSVGDVIGVIIIGLIFVSCIVCILWFIFTALKAEDKEDKSEIGRTNLDRFFVECVLASCNDFSKPKNLEKAKLLADKYALSYPNGIEILYQEGLKAHETISANILGDKLTEVRQIEQAEFNLLNRYVTYYGRDKKIVMLTDRMNELRQRADSLNKSADMLSRAVQQKEYDWAIWGGLAEGLAGPAAGIATALDIQAENAQIRAQNEANKEAIKPAYMSTMLSASLSRGRATEIEEEIQHHKEKLLCDLPANDVMKKLCVVNPTVNISETGALKITATVEAPKKLYIFDDVPAVADGTIVAHIFEDGKEVGIANMVLPINGVSGKAQIVGMMLSGAHREKKQMVSFSAGNLWLMEQ